METFEIEVGDIVYTITPCEDHTYLVNGDYLKDVIIAPNLDDSGVVWYIISGDYNQDLINSIGDGIEEHDM